MQVSCTSNRPLVELVDHIIGGLLVSIHHKERHLNVTRVVHIELVMKYGLLEKKNAVSIRGQPRNCLANTTISLTNIL